MSSRKKSKTPNSDDENFCSPKKKKTKLKLNSVNAENKGAINNVRKYPSCNILKYYSNYEMGLPCQKYKKPLKNLIINYCKTFQLYKVEAPFDRRVTYLVWHPINPKLLSVTSHGGDVILYNYEQDISSASMIKGVGHGGSVQVNILI